MKLDLKLIFPKSPPHPRAKIVARMSEIKKTLSSKPGWLLGEKGGMVRCVPKESNDCKPNALNDFHNYRSEKNLSSKVRREPVFVFPQRSTGIGPFQLFSKTKRRKNVLQTWEFLMLDLWSHILRHYSSDLPIVLSAPQAYKIEEETLCMAYELGTIAAKLAQDYRSSFRVPLSFGKLRLYEAFALHLGALAHVKEAEELLHGDYKLRHLLFDPGNQSDAFSFIVKNTFNALTGDIQVVEPFLSIPSLSVVDLEHALRAPKTKVQKENDKMLKQARRHTLSHGLQPSVFEKAYRNGYDLIRPLEAAQGFVDRQHARWGFSADTAF